MCDTSDRDVLSSARGREEPAGRLGLAAVACLIVVAIDQLSKWWAESRLEEGACTPATCIEILGTPLRFRLLYNTGAAFSRGTEFGPIIGVIAVVMSVYLFYLASRSSDRVMVVLFGVVAGGAIGNLIDRLARADDGFLSGGVVDFVDVRFWPVFNVADAAIVCGVIALAVRQYTAGSGTDQPETEPG